MRRGHLSFSLKPAAWFLLLFGLVISFVLFFSVYRQEQRNEYANFERRAQLQIAAIKEGMRDAINALTVVNQLFVTNGSVSREQFHTFTQPLLLRHPYIAAFSFQRLVAGNQRAAFEARMRSSYPGYFIHEFVGGKRTVATVRDRYHVIDYVEPMAGNEVAFGLDASTQPFHADVMHRAENAGRPAATGISSLHSADQGKRGFHLVMAAYTSVTSLNDSATRKKALTGYTVAVLDADKLFRTILATAGMLGNTATDLRMYATATDESKLAYAQASAENKNQEGWRPVGLFGEQRRLIKHSFDFAGTTWQIVISAQPAPFITTYAYALIAFLMGLVITLVAVGHLQSAAKANALLVEDIKARKLVERALIASEERARELADLSSDWYWEQDEHFRFASFSPITMGKFGPPSWVKLGAHPWDLPVDFSVSDWPAHRAMLESHQPFKNFELKVVIDDMPIQWISASGKPLFDANGRFKGYFGTGRDISVRKAAEDALRLSRTMLRELADHQEVVREDERKRIALDIHDGLGQNLLVLKMDVAALDARTKDTHPRLNKRASLVLNNINDTIKTVKSIMNDLRPSILELGLYPAVEWQLKDFERVSGIVCQLEASDEAEFGLDTDRTSAVFRILQESLTNVARHAQATEVKITLCRDKRGFRMTVRDNGKGLEPCERRKVDSFGLMGIEERTHALGGQFTIESSPDIGTALSISLQ